MTPHELNRLYVTVLALEWILFGTVHFTHPEVVVAEMGGLFGDDDLLAKGVAIGTGILQVCIGFFIVMHRTRKWAAAASLGLLMLYVWPVFNMLMNGANPEYGHAAWRAISVAIVVPNNLFLGIASWSLFREPHVEAGARDKGELSAFLQTGLTSHASTLIVAALLLAANCAGFLVLVFSRAEFSTASLWAMMCIVGGALVGFLFGVPRLNQRALSDSQYRPNTNIEEISDWFTKMIVGIGVVNYPDISGRLWLATRDLALATGSSHEFAMAIVGYFSLVGFVQGYLLTRMFLAREFDDSRRPTKTRERSSARGRQASKAGRG